MEHEAFTWFNLIPFLKHIPNQVISAIFVGIFLITISIILRIKLGLSKDRLIPNERVSIQNIFEVLTETLIGLMRDIIGPHSERFFPLIGTLTLFIFFSNVLGLIPGFLPPTNNLNTTLACALAVFFYYNYWGFKEHGMKYIKHFLGPIWWLSPLMFPIEVISHLARPLSLSLRLFGNITGDHLVLMMALLIPIVVPALALGLGIFVAIIQTLIFIFLSMMYISLALIEEEH
jgi:F-type H+-transporting ATPase subunit a